MDPFLQWLMGLSATLLVVAATATARTLTNIKDELGEVRKSFELFAQSAESRFERIEERQDQDAKRVRNIEERIAFDARHDAETGR